MGYPSIFPTGTTIYQKESIASYKKSGKYAVKLTAKKKGTTTLTCKVKNGKPA